MLLLYKAEFNSILQLYFIYKLNSNFCFSALFEMIYIIITFYSKQFKHGTQDGWYAYILSYSPYRCKVDIYQYFTILSLIWNEPVLGIGYVSSFMVDNDCC